MGTGYAQGHARPTTMADLAKIAGVSVTTVSHVLNESRFVSQEARERVSAAVRDTGYTKNILARSMKTASTSTIGLAAPALSKVALADLVRPIEATARAQGLSILLTDTEDDPDVELTAVQALHARRVDGIIIAPAGADTPAVQYLRRHNIATVVVDRLTSGGFDQIGTENTRPTRQLTEHLLDGGHRRVALITGMPNLSTSTERRAGYVKALRSRGIDVDRDLMDAAHDDPERLRTILDRLLSLADPPTAVVAGNSSATIGVMRAASARGVRVPEDLALVGFDDFEWADVFHPRLTVIRQRVEEIGATAVHLLQHRIANPDTPGRTRRVRADFIHRESCGCSPSPS